MLLLHGVTDIGLLIWVIRYQRTITQIRRGGIVTEGKVIEREKESIGRTLIFRAYYEFYIESNDSNNGRWVGSQMIGWAHYNRLKVGDQISISYLPKRSVISRLAGKDTDHSSRDTALIWIIGTFLFWVIFLNNGLGLR
jgi:hypothetical protein